MTNRRAGGSDLPCLTHGVKAENNYQKQIPFIRVGCNKNCHDFPVQLVEDFWKTFSESDTFKVVKDGP